MRHTLNQIETMGKKEVGLRPLAFGKRQLSHDYICDLVTDFTDLNIPVKDVSEIVTHC